MPRTKRREKLHATKRKCYAKREACRKTLLASDLIRDIVIGMADGLTVPFALAAGLSGTISNTSLVVIAKRREFQGETDDAYGEAWHVPSADY